MMNEEFVPDISLPEIKDKVLIDNPKSLELVKRLKKTTNARLGVGRAGDRFKTETLLKFRADHAIAQDAVWTEIDESLVDEMGFYKVQTMVNNKEEYVRRPDLGRIFSAEADAYGCPVKVHPGFPRYEKKRIRLYVSLPDHTAVPHVPDAVPPHIFHG